LIQKQFFNVVGYFDESNQTVQDIEMWLRIVASGYHIFFLNEILCRWRDHNNSGSNRLRSQQKQDLQTLFNKILEEYPIEFFSSNPSNYKLTAKEKSVIYRWLGNNAQGRGSVESAKECYRRAIKMYPSPINVAIIKYLRILFS
jgi:tetratricopeptide (TPR) repeat protein